MKTRIFIILIVVSLILLGLALAQETPVVSVPDSKTDITKEKAANSQISYMVYEVHDLDSLIATRKAINLELAEKDKPLAHGKFLAFNPHIVEQVSGGLLIGNKLNLTYYKKPCILFVVLNQRFKLGQLGAVVINVKKKIKTITVRWTGKEVKVELKFYQGQLI